ncbi:probable disease resistance protein At4g19060 [Neltuma alba]|uniref:probable disease resistance protein At4g19060 n=1 Tax=Neltuma alba TaxID=207710 RepID=UPI0010A36685|nr:probable disease resistance protein At4g19060 [Prosopis alba]
MASSDVARFLIKQYLQSIDKETSYLSDPTLDTFKAIGDSLKTKLMGPESNSWLSDLNDTLTEWQILKEQDKYIKRIFSCQYHMARRRERSAIDARLNRMQTTAKEITSNSVKSSPEKNFPLSDQCPSCEPDRITTFPEVQESSGKLEKQMVDWLSTPGGDDFKAVGICGMGGSGKTALVNSLIWAGLSDLMTREEEKEIIDVRIMKHLLYCLGLDTDGMAGNFDGDKDRLMEELERRLLTISRNYILVLDDMWHCTEWFADNLLGKLKKHEGGAVIVTSRKKSVAQKFGANNRLIHLNPFDYRESAFLPYIRLQPPSRPPAIPLSISLMDY